MRKYELVCIVQPELDETAFKGVVDRVTGWVTEAGGSVDKVDVWGRRRLAYQIRKQREGQYVLMNVTLDPKATSHSVKVVVTDGSRSSEKIISLKAGE